MAVRKTQGTKSLTVNPDLKVIESLLDARGISGVTPEQAAARFVRYVASDEGVDTMGDVILAAGWDLSEWLTNPALFANHDTQDVASCVGRGLNAQVMGKTLVVDAFFLPSELAPSGLADACWKMVKAGILTDCSVGFWPKQGGWRWATDADKALYGKDCSGVFTAQTLKELSCVGVGANARAKVEAVAKMLHARELTEGDVEALQDSDEFSGLVERALFRIAPRTSVQAPAAKGITAPDLAPLLAQVEGMRKDFAAMRRADASAMRQKELGLGVFIPLEDAQNIATWAEAIEDTLAKHLPNDDDSDEDSEVPADPVAPPYSSNALPATELASVTEGVKGLLNIMHNGGSNHG